MNTKNKKKLQELAERIFKKYNIIVRPVETKEDMINSKNITAIFSKESR